MSDDEISHSDDEGTGVHYNADDLNNKRESSSDSDILPDFPTEPLTSPENLEHLYNTAIASVPYFCANMLRELNTDYTVFISSTMLIPTLSKYYSGTGEEWRHDIAIEIRRWLVVHGYKFSRVNDFAFRVEREPPPRKVS